jgi:hypothetical protein
MNAGGGEDYVRAQRKVRPRTKGGQIRELSTVRIYWMSEEGRRQTPAGRLLVVCGRANSPNSSSIYFQVGKVVLAQGTPCKEGDNPALSANN